MDKFKRFRFIVKFGDVTSPHTNYSDAFAAARRLARTREKGGAAWPEIEDTQAKPGRARRWQVVSTGPTQGDTVARVLDKAPAELTVEPVDAPRMFPAIVFRPGHQPRPDDLLSGVPDTVFQYAAVAYEGRRQAGGDWPVWVDRERLGMPKFVTVIAEAYGIADVTRVEAVVRSIVADWATAWVARAALMAAAGVDNE